MLLAGIHLDVSILVHFTWMPAFAGMMNFTWSEGEGL
jgi:hypothetical protein